jgi:ABC-type lipoprotein export system ATPase subunit
VSNWGSFGSRGRPVRRPPERPVARAKPGDVQPATPGERLTWGEAPGEVRLAAEETLVQFHHVYKIYRIADTGVVALGGVDLQVPKAEFLAVVGPSGSGKSTILNLAGGLDGASAGAVEVDGRDLGRLSDEELTEYRRDQVGFVWQGTARNLVPYLSIRDNVGLPLIAKGQARWTAKRAEELLEAVGLGDRARHRPGELSGGEQQRAAIAVALANLPSLLLTDEPTAELDSESAERVLTAFRAVNREFRVTIIMATHDLVAAKVADRSVRIRDGKLVHEGHPVGRLGEEGQVTLPPEAIQALWGADVEAEIHDGEIRLRRKSERGLVGGSRPVGDEAWKRPKAAPQTEDAPAAEHTEGGTGG